MSDELPLVTLDNQPSLWLVAQIKKQSEQQNEGGEPDRFIPQSLDAARLDKAVKEHFGLSWIKARSWIDTGKVFLNGNKVLAQDLRVSAGDRVELRMSERRVRDEPKIDPSLVVHYDDDIVVANKPIGVMTVPHPESEEIETLDRLTHSYLRIHDPSTRRNKASLGVVHRIDKETSGLVVFARSHKALQGLSQQFRAHTIERKYFAVVHGSLKPQSIRTRIARDNGGGIRGSVPEGAVNKAGEELGRLAITHVEVVRRLKGSTLVACRIETGRTHQIRIHLSEIGHPILGEKVYIRGYRGEVIAADRVMLHAGELGFLHPISGESVKWTMDLPDDFKRRLRSLELDG